MSVMFMYKQNSTFQSPILVTLEAIFREAEYIRNCNSQFRMDINFFRFLISKTSFQDLTKALEL